MGLCTTSGVLLIWGTSGFNELIIKVCVHLIILSICRVNRVQSVPESEVKVHEKRLATEFY